MRLFICALWSPAGKGLTSWLSFVVSTVGLSLSHWYPGSGVALNCIDSLSLHPYLLLFDQFILSIYAKHITSTARKPYKFVVFQWGEASGPPVLPLDPPMNSLALRFSRYQEANIFINPQKYYPPRLSSESLVQK